MTVTFYTSYIYVFMLFCHIFMFPVMWDICTYYTTFTYSSFVCKPGPWLSIMWTRAQGPALISLWGLLSRTVVKYSHVKWPIVVLWYKDNLSVCCTKLGPPLPTVNLFFPYLWAYFFITWYDLLVNNLILQIEQSGRIYRKCLYRNLWHIFFFF